MQGRLGRIDPPQRALAALLLLLAVANLIVLAGTRQEARGLTYFNLPLPNGASIHAHVGERLTRGASFTPQDLLPNQRIMTRMHIGVWYRTGPGWTGRRLLDVALPAWPLPIMSLAVAGAALAAGAARRWWRHG